MFFIKSLEIDICIYKVGKVKEIYLFFIFMMKKISKLIFTLMVICISIGSVFARVTVEVNSETFDL